MKFTAALTAIFALPLAGAFAPQSSSSLKAAPLQSSYFPGGNGDRYSDRRYGSDSRYGDRFGNSYSNTDVRYGDNRVGDRIYPTGRGRGEVTGVRETGGNTSINPNDNTRRGSNYGRTRDGRSNRDIFERTSALLVQGGSLRTWAFEPIEVERVSVSMKTEGRPLNANVELWQGPDNSPQKMAVYVEDGSVRPFRAIIETPRGQNAIAIRNTGQMEFPLAAIVEPEMEGMSNGFGAEMARLSRSNTSRTIQGGAVYTYAFEPNVGSVQVMLKTDGRPLNARIELLQGPNNNKQVVELYSEDGYDRPFYSVIETPGSGNVVRIVNTATMEFPLTACVEPFMIESYYGRSSTYRDGMNRNIREGNRGNTNSPFIVDRPW